MREESWLVESARSAMSNANARWRNSDENEIAACTLNHMRGMANAVFLQPRLMPARAHVMQGLSFHAAMKSSLRSSPGSWADGCDVCLCLEQRPLEDVLLGAAR
jgi:hypothetical protein